MKITYYIARRIIFTAFISVSLIALGAAISAVSALDKYEAIIKEIDSITSKSVSVESEEDQCFFVRRRLSAMSTDLSEELVTSWDGI